MAESYIPWPTSNISVTSVNILERTRSIPQETLCKVRLVSDTKIKTESAKFKKLFSNDLMVTRGKRERDKWEFGIDKYTLLYIK